MLRGRGFEQMRVGDICICLTGSGRHMPSMTAELDALLAAGYVLEDDWASADPCYSLTTWGRECPLPVHPADTTD